jgi:hypothetical protein
MNHPRPPLTEQDAAIAWALAHNTLDPMPLAPLLDDDIHVASQQVWEEMVGRAEYLAYLQELFSMGDPLPAGMRMELARTRRHTGSPFPGRPCVIGHIGDEPVITVFFSVADDTIRRIEIRTIPPPSCCARIGIFPGLEEPLLGEVN